VSGLRTSSDLELLVRVRRDDGEPLHQQLEAEIREAIRGGRLEAGSVVPSSRALARDLGLSRGVVIEAYEQLVAEGYLATRPGGATRVAEAAARRQTATVEPAAQPPRIDFRYGRPDVSQFPRAVWLRSLRRVLNEAPNDRLSYGDGHGAPELRTALAAYLDRVRGTCAHPDHIVITTGFAQGIGLIVRVLRATGARRLAVEDPSLDESRAMARAAGLEVIGIPVDEAGMRVEALEQSNADAVLVTPAHQMPTGGVLPADRRQALVAWAKARDGLIIEDDYDAEYRYDRTPIGAIQGLAPGRVIYGGSGSKTLAPGLRLGWLLAPPSIVEALATAKEAADRGSPIIEQLAFADFLARGEFDRHLRRMRPLYRGRRDALLSTLRQRLPDLRPVGASAGLHVLAWLPPRSTEAEIIEAAARRGLGVYGLAKYWMSGGPAGLLFGYATLSEAVIEEGVALLAATFDELRGRGKRWRPRTRGSQPQLQTMVSDG
jgi:GntR family transcriptional regulator/MocR family aminotransferase